MSYNGSGTFLINTAGQPVVSGTVISSTAFNALTADLATGLSTAITKDGQTTVTANIPMSTFKFTGLGAGSAATDSVNLSQVQSTVSKLLNTITGTNTITATASPTLSAYAAGQMFYFVAAGDNTTAVTLNIDGLGAKAVTRDGSTALISGDIKSGEVVVVVYDGTRFQVVSQVNSAGDVTFANVSITSALNVGGVATFMSNPVLSGGTANGVLYLNGSKVATSGSVLTFDGQTLTNTRDTPILNLNDTAASNVALRLLSTGGLTYIQSGISGGAFASIAFTSNGGGSEQMRLTSTGLGIGTTSPSRRLEVASSTTALIRITSSGAQTGYAANEFYNAAGFGYCGTESSTAGTLFSGTTAYATVLGNTAAYPLQLATNNTVRATIDSSGNLGLGVTPSASWFASSKAIQIGSAGAPYMGLAQQTTTTCDGYMLWGARLSGDRAFQYTSTGDAVCAYRQNAGTHNWFTAASGTAGNAISFTQAMTLDASGNLLVGITSASASSRLRLRSSGSTISTVCAILENSVGTQLLYARDDGYFAIPSSYNNTSGSAANVFMDASGFLYRSTSSLKYKKDIQDATHGLAEVMALRPVTYKGNAETDADKVFGGLIAEEVDAAGLSEFVVYDADGKPDALHYGNMVSLLVKAVQELKAELDALKGAK